MKNLFKNAYFGKPYKTRDERKAIYIKAYTSFGDIKHYLIKDDSNYGYGRSVKPNGLQFDNEENPSDIVSEWYEPIDKNKLNRLVKKYIKEDSIKKQFIMDLEKLLQGK